MIKKVIRIDTDGLYVEDVLLNDGQETPSDCIEIFCPDGFYKPKWDGTEWIEGGIAPVETAEQEIARLKAELKETDYKIIKCSEYQLAEQLLPYDIATLHAERQALRDRINELELTLV